MRLSYSGYSTFHECQKKFFLTYILRKVPREKPDYFILGDAYHHAWRTYLHPNGEELSHEQKMVITKDILWNYCPDETAREAWRLFAANVIEPWNPPIEKILSVEQYIEIPFYHHTVVIKGDAIAHVTWEGAPALAHIEHKTSSQIGTNYKNRQRHGPQILCYTWGLSLGLKKPIKFGYFNVVSKTKVPQTWRELVPIDPDSLRRWEISLAGTFDLIEFNIKKGFPEGWAENLESCHTFYGRCDYYPICQYHPFKIPGDSWPGWAGFKDKEDVR